MFAVLNIQAYLSEEAQNWVRLELSFQKLFDCYSIDYDKLCDVIDNLF